MEPNKDGGDVGADPHGRRLQGRPPRPRVTLKTVAQHLGVSPATVSLVLNRSPVADAIPAKTQDRVFAAARELGYRPDLLARSLRGKRSFLLGVLVPEISEGYASGVMNGVISGPEQGGLEPDYSYVIAKHHWRPDVLENYLQQLEDRRAEGLITIATPLTTPPSVPTVAVAGRHSLEGVTQVVVDHDRAAQLAIGHLVELGHRHIAFFRGADGNADAEDRWRAFTSAARSHGIEIRPELTPQLASRSCGPTACQQGGYEEGYAYGQRLLASGAQSSLGRDRSTAPLGFTALCAFNDFSAIGAMRAFLDDGLRVPHDVSVIGFDDIHGAAFQNPTLTTIRQPLSEMGATARRLLSQRLSTEEPTPEVVTVSPELVVRASTGPAPRATGRSRQA